MYPPPPYEKSLFLMGAYFGVGVYYGKYGHPKFDGKFKNRLRNVVILIMHAF